MPQCLSDNAVVRQIPSGSPLPIGMFCVGMQVRIRTNSLEFEFAPNSHEFVDPSEFEFATSNSNSPLIRLNSPEAENP